MSQPLLSEPPFLQAVTNGINASACVNNHISLPALQDAVRAFDAVREEFPHHMAPVDWIDLARIVWMFSHSERTLAHWTLTRHALNKVGLYHLAIQTKEDGIRHVINVIKKLYDNAMKEIWYVPTFIPQPPIDDANDEVGAESEEAAATEGGRDPNENGSDHVIAVDGMRRIKHNYLALALRDQTANRGANDDELKRRNLAFECPYFCRPDGNAAIIERANNMTRHMQRVHGRPRGFRVTIVDAVGKQYQMAGRGETEVLWKLVPRK